MENTILNYSRWIIFRNNAVRYNVGENNHEGWYVNEYGYWKSKTFSTHEVERGVSGNYTVLGDSTQEYTLPYLRKFMPSVYQ
jgi:hypothetical protein